MAYDTHSLLAYSTVATAPSPATSGTSLVVASGDGAKFHTGQNCTVWPTGVQPTTTNAEIVRITAISTDTLTITRTQEGSSARSIIIGDQIANTITPKVLTDIEAQALGGTVTSTSTDTLTNKTLKAPVLQDSSGNVFGTLTVPSMGVSTVTANSTNALNLVATGGVEVSGVPIVTTTATQTLTNKTIAAGSNTISGLTNTNLSGSAGITPANLSITVFETIYPVGALYFSATVSTSPATVLGFGTWVAIGGYTLVGYKSGDTNFGATGVVTAGEATHTLTSAEMPSHTHTISGFGTTYNINSGVSATTAIYSGSLTTGSTGSGGAHNNIQPSFVVYIWYRSA